LGLSRKILNPKQLPTAKNRANKSTQKVDSQFVYYHVFTSFAHHKLPENIDGLRLIIMSAISSTVPSLWSGTSNLFVGVYIVVVCMDRLYFTWTDLVEGWSVSRKITILREAISPMFFTSYV
jgi:hypothetical protein